jgi:hypothetical protein
MPAKSRKQQRYLAQKFGPAWLKAHHYDNKTIPKKKKAKPKAKKRA